MHRRETLGRHSHGQLKLTGVLTECDLMEWKDLEVARSVKDCIEIALAPFEIKTWRYRPAT